MRKSAALGQTTVETPSDGAQTKISPGESEDLPGLSAGSSDSEELPDPTCGSYPGLTPAVNSLCGGNDAICARKHHGVAFGPGTSVRPRTLSRDGRGLRPRWLACAGAARV